MVFWTTEAIMAVILCASSIPGLVPSCCTNPDCLLRQSNAKHLGFVGQGFLERIQIYHIDFFVQTSVEILLVSFSPWKRTAALSHGRRPFIPELYAGSLTSMLLGTGDLCTYYSMLV